MADRTRLFTACLSTEERTRWIENLETSNAMQIASRYGGMLITVFSWEGLVIDQVVFDQRHGWYRRTAEASRINHTYINGLEY